MILDAIRFALARLLTPSFRGVLWKSLGLTLAALATLWFAVNALADGIALPWLEALGANLLGGWTGVVATLVAIAAGFASALLLAFLIAPVTAIIASLFLDDVAEIIERNDYSEDRPGRALPTGRSLVLSVRFVALAIGANLAALALLLVPGINIAAFFIANGYVLGREYFAFAALRHMSEADADALRKRHAGTVFFAGLAIAAFLAIPLVNFLTPLFAAALMVRLQKSVAATQPA
jgi:CysZ protein